MKEAIRTVAPGLQHAADGQRVRRTALRARAAPTARRMDANHYALARELADWKQHGARRLAEVSIRAEGPREGRLSFGDPVRVEACVQLGRLRPEDVRVELVAARDENGVLRERRVRGWSRPRDADGDTRYTAHLCPINGSLVYGVRVRQLALGNPLELGLARWA